MSSFLLDFVKQKGRFFIMAFSLKGIHLSHKKHTAGMKAERLVTKNTVTLPMVSHIGSPSVPVVKAGDEVKVGTLVAKAGAGFSSPMYSSVSGKVVGVSEIFASNGARIQAVVFDSDGEMTPDEAIAPAVIDSKEALIEAMKQSGVVGFGGAGFPTYAKFSTDKKIDFLIINGAECEPYITSDDYVMTEHSEDIAYAIDVITKFIDIEKVIIAVEGNKASAIEKMKKLAADNSKTKIFVNNLSLRVALAKATKYIKTMASDMIAKMGNTLRQ